MKKVKVIVAMVMTTLVLANVMGCNGKKETAKPNTENKVEIEQKEEVVDYKKLYKDEIDKLIAEFGQFDASEVGYPVKGVKYGELIDFDNDKIPEMLVAHDQKVLIYKVKDGEAKCIYEEKAESKYRQTDIARDININLEDGKVSLVIYKTQRPAHEEVINVVTIENNEVKIKKLYGKIKGDSDNPLGEKLQEFYIDDKSVSSEEYNKVHDEFIKNSKSIDLVGENDISGKANLEEFINSLK